MAASNAPRAVREVARSFPQLAREEAHQGYATKDRGCVRDAAEVAWIAALQAADGAMERHEFLEAAGRGELSAKLHEVADRLHGRYLFIGSVPDRKERARRLGEVVDDVRQVTEGV